MDPGKELHELGVLPRGPYASPSDSIRHIILLGKTLFFDERLSGSNRISCASCHKPELSWTDGRAKSIGHAGLVNKRNSPTIQNAWFYHKLFWDGRSHSLEDQAFAPINSESEMSSDMPQVTGKLRRIKGYRPLFDSAFGNHQVTPEQLTEALAIFQRTIVSDQSAFDKFLLGQRDALSDEQLRGLNLFRTKARCINCHNGPLFSDNEFHNTGFARIGQQGEDMGRFIATKKEEDKGRFKTPSLRDVTFTGPWMHNGSATALADIITHYNEMPPAFNTDKILRPLKLTAREQTDLLAFLQSISSAPLPFTLPKKPE
nr:cytochrome c peroxidase [Ferruginibacter sp. HRS2-29]